MMSIAKVTNSKYHLEHSQFDYYSEQENEKGEFRGALMKWQKLEGKVIDEKTFMKQVDRGGEDNKGIDLCFSPPKDWTLLYNLVDPETKLKMDEIRDKAVSAVVKGIEQNTYYRETKDGDTKFKLAKGVGMATFNHHTGREVKDEKINPGGYVDCQEHTHITVFPKVLGQDGKFHSNTLLDMKYEDGNNHESLRYLDQLGQYELCKGLQDLGYSVYEADKHGNFAIEGITDDLRNEFSKRKEQINDKAGTDATYRMKKEISLKFRAGKDSHDLASLKEIWKEKMESMGFNDEKVKSLKTNRVTHKERNIEDLIDKDSVLSNKKIKILALSESKFTKTDYKDKLEEFKGDSKVKAIGKNHNIYADNKFKEKIASTYQKLDPNRNLTIKQDFGYVPKTKGTVKSMGQAHYKDDTKQKMSFFVELEFGKGKTRKIWSKDLEKICRQNDIKVGDFAGFEKDTKNKGWLGLNMNDFREKKENEYLTKRLTKQQDFLKGRQEKRNSFREKKMESNSKQQAQNPKAPKAQQAQKVDKPKEKDTPVNSSSSSGGGGGGGGSSSGAGKNEIISDIKNLELDLLGIPFTPENQIKRWLLEEQLGNLKHRLSQMDENNKSGGGGGSSGGSGGGGSGGKKDQGTYGIKDEKDELDEKEEKPNKQFKGEEQENNLLKLVEGTLEDFDNNSEKWSSNKMNNELKTALADFQSQQKQIISKVISQEQQMQTQQQTELTK